MILIQRLLFFILLLLILWQVVLPWVFMKPIFPIFRTKKLVDELKDLNEQEELDALEKRINELKEKQQRANAQSQQEKEN